MVVGFEAGEGSIKHFTPRNHDDVEARSAVGSAKYFTGETFCSISIDGWPELSSGGDPEPPRGPAVGQHEQGHEPAVNPNALLINSIELEPVADTFGGGQHMAAHALPPLVAALISRRRRSAACDPSPGDA